MYSHCSICNTSLNSKSQWDQHISGEKHKKKAKLHEVLVTSPAQSMPLLAQRPASMLQVNTDALDTLAIIETKGAFRCKVCPNFLVHGIIPMRDHLKGSKHQKALQKAIFLQGMSSSMVQSSVPSISNRESAISNKTQLPPEEQIKQAWTHEILCGYNYESGPDTNCNVTSPHFAYFPKHVPIPSVLKYLHQEN